jgi:hypothetical protein
MEAYGERSHGDDRPPATPVIAFEWNTGEMVHINIAFYIYCMIIVNFCRILCSFDACIAGLWIQPVKASPIIARSGLGCALCSGRNYDIYFL